jgi:hypothetical protein
VFGIDSSASEGIQVICWEVKKISSIYVCFPICLQVSEKAYVADDYVSEGFLFYVLTFPSVPFRIVFFTRRATPLMGGNMEVFA